MRRILAQHAYDLFAKEMANLPGNYLEIGTFEGGMLLRLGQQYPDKMFYAIDPFIEDGYTIGHNESVAKGERLNYSAASTYSVLQDTTNACLFEMPSQAFLADLNDALRDMLNISAVFIDGEHSKEAASNDFELAMRLLVNGGIIYADDVGLPAVAEAVAEFKEKYGPRLTPVSTHQSLECCWRVSV